MLLPSRCSLLEHLVKQQLKLMKSEFDPAIIDLYHRWSKRGVDDVTPIAAAAFRRAVLAISSVLLSGHMRRAFLHLSTTMKTSSAPRAKTTNTAFKLTKGKLTRRAFKAKLAGEWFSWHRMQSEKLYLDSQFYSSGKIEEIANRKWKHIVWCNDTIVKNGGSWYETKCIHRLAGHCKWPMTNL